MQASSNSIFYSLKLISNSLYQSSKFSRALKMNKFSRYHCDLLKKFANETVQPLQIIKISNCLRDITKTNLLTSEYS